MALEGFPIFLVRHGRDKPETGRLTQAGEEHAKRALDQLLVLGLGHATVVLSTLSTRAEQTANIIRKGLGCREVLLGSVGFTRYSSRPEGLENLDSLIEAELATHNAQPNPNGGLVVVTSSPLIAVAKGLDSSANMDAAVPHGNVFQYQPGTWVPLHLSGD